ncbi:MAG: hypothetical protein JO205_08275 [Pseudolabrys sp.]|nr:hypothetical protein [Pseudolabrys sp.]MBV9261354.1 hypothetical protein [Pseudolabrys sp.]
MTTRSKATADEIAAIEDLMTDLEKRLKRLSGTARSEASGASSDIHDFVSDALQGVMRRVRTGAESITESVADEATRVGGHALKRVLGEVEHRPVAVLAVAAGLGYLLGAAQRR